MTGQPKEMTKRERLKEFQANYDKLGFSKFLCGDEAIVSVGEDDKIRISFRFQESADSSRNMSITFDTQSQMERLLPAIVKSMKR